MDLVVHLLPPALEELSRVRGVGVMGGQHALLLLVRGVVGMPLRRRSANRVTLSLQGGLSRAPPTTDALPGRTDEVPSQDVVEVDLAVIRAGVGRAVRTARAEGREGVFPLHIRSIRRRAAVSGGLGWVARGHGAGAAGAEVRRQHVLVLQQTQ